MGKEVVLDVETKKIFSELSKRDPKLLGISYVGIYELEHDKLHGFFEEELSGLWKILEHATRIVGYNIKKFDIPVLSAYYPGDLMQLPLFDMWEEVKKSSGQSLRLDNLARATLGEEKTGTGLDAIRYFREGKLKKLASYCLQDVKLTKKLYEYGIEHGKLKYYNWKDEIQECELGWAYAIDTKSDDFQMSLGV